MKQRFKFALIIYIVSTSFAFAQNGCFFKPENQYLQIGAVRSVKNGTNICTKLPNGNYVWVSANKYDMSGGCWYRDKYPANSILMMVGQLKQCVYENNHYRWVAYKS